MAENIVQMEDLGEIIVAPEVIEVIIGINTAKVDGVYALRNKRLVDVLGKKSEGRGVYLEVKDSELIANIYVYLTYGSNAPSVALEIQKTVKEAVEKFTEITLSDVNIHIMGVVAENLEKPEFEELFDEGFFDA
ncbi:MAG: Asp23/Gls24 family envelope stress response protein [Streptococcaceae bacterium]|nr:Asp23/Gls24 family envelope stress response protein [Streptococcaceae bacterium]MCL2681633.1 Asp23/Gls24 family envelope stress response protein [Streptococcaceae bacterium]MCL2858852.1 Asp23/Gls24 family envelope stress response protein [Streptococcaceae bacterium]